MEKEDHQTRESSGILNVLFKEIQISGSIEKYLQLEWKASIKRDYQIDMKILKMAKNPDHMTRYLNICSTTIVEPMNRELKLIMRMFKIATESEIFCNDLSYKFLHCDDDKNKFNTKRENDIDDSKEHYYSFKKVIVDTFKEKFKFLIENHLARDPDAKLNLSVALYFATYYD